MQGILLYDFEKAPSSIGSGEYRWGRGPSWSGVRFVPMADSHVLALDTAPDARALQFEKWAKSSPARKFEMIEAQCNDVRMLARAGIRQRFPDATPREQDLRLGALTIERWLMIEAFGWDSEQRGR